MHKNKKWTSLNLILSFTFQNTEYLINNYAVALQTSQQTIQLTVSEANSLYLEGVVT